MDLLIILKKVESHLIIDRWRSNLANWNRLFRCRGGNGFFSDVLYKERAATLTQFMGLGKVNTIELAQANKCMHLSAMAYNLKTCLPVYPPKDGRQEYLKFVTERTKSGAGCLAFTCSLEKLLQKWITPFLRHPNIDHFLVCKKNKAT